MAWLILIACGCLKLALGLIAVTASIDQSSLLYFTYVILVRFEYHLLLSLLFVLYNKIKHPIHIFLGVGGMKSLLIYTTQSKINQGSCICKILAF